MSNDSSLKGKTVEDDIKVDIDGLLKKNKKDIDDLLKKDEENDVKINIDSIQQKDVEKKKLYDNIEINIDMNCLQQKTFKGGIRVHIIGMEQVLSLREIKFSISSIDQEYHTDDIKISISGMRQGQSAKSIDINFINIKRAPKSTNVSIIDNKYVVISEEKDYYKDIVLTAEDNIFSIQPQISKDVKQEEWKFPQNLEDVKQEEWKFPQDLEDVKQDFPKWYDKMKSLSDNNQWYHIKCLLEQPHAIVDRVEHLLHKCWRVEGHENSRIYDILLYKIHFIRKHNAKVFLEKEKQQVVEEKQKLYKYPDSKEEMKKKFSEWREKMMSVNDKVQWLHIKNFMEQPYFIVNCVEECLQDWSSSVGHREEHRLLTDKINHIKELNLARETPVIELSSYKSKTVEPWKYPDTKEEMEQQLPKWYEKIMSVNDLLQWTYIKDLTKQSYSILICVCVFLHNKWWSKNEDWLAGKNILGKIEVITGKILQVFT